MLAATSSWVDSGLDAQSTRSAPPALRVRARLAVSAVTCRQADILIPASGFSVANRSRMARKTGMSRSAHSIRCLPTAASEKSFTSPLCAFAVTIANSGSPEKILKNRTRRAPCLGKESRQLHLLVVVFVIGHGGRTITSSDSRRSAAGQEQSQGLTPFPVHPVKRTGLRWRQVCRVHQSGKRKAVGPRVSGRCRGQRPRQRLEQGPVGLGHRHP